MTQPVALFRNTVPGILVWVWLILVFPGFAGAWEVAQDKDGITVYTRVVQGCSFKEYKAVTQVDATLASLVALVADITACPEWIYTCKSGRLLDRISPTETFTYTVNEAPWPVSDRDAVVRNVLTFEPRDRSVTITITGVPDYIPPVKGRVRVKMIQGCWRFTQIAENRVQVVYQVLNDPGGNLPSWLVNSVVVSQPYHTLMNLIKMLKLAKYRDAASDFYQK